MKQAVADAARERVTFNQVFETGWGGSRETIFFTEKGNKNQRILTQLSGVNGS